MTKLANTNKEILSNILNNSNKWSKDRYGNFNSYGKDYRVKFQDTSFRIETKVVHDSGYITHSWVKIGGGYYKDITLENGCVMVAGKKIRKDFF